MAYQIRTPRDVQKQLDRLPRTLYDRVDAHIQALRIQPRPPGVKKLKGTSAYRIRVGDCRIIYTVDDAAQVIDLLEVGDRKGIYRQCVPIGNESAARSRDHNAAPSTGVACNCTQGILMGDYLQAILTNQHLPADLARKAAGSIYFGQYCPGAPAWLCRPEDLPGTDLTDAFAPG